MLMRYCLIIAALVVLPLMAPPVAAKQRLWVFDGDTAALAELRQLGAVPVGRLPGGGLLIDLGQLDRAQLGRSRSRWPLSAWTTRRSPNLDSAITLGGPAQVNVVAVIARPGVSRQQLAVAVARLTPQLDVVEVHDHPRFPRVLVSGTGETLRRSLDMLAASDLVLWLEPHALMQPLNSDSVEPLQSNCGPGQAQPCSPSLPLQLTPVWDQDLIGSGQIIAVADTGLDRNEDWFTEYNDGSGSLEALTDAANPTPPAPGPLFPGRKVVGYWVMPGATAYDEFTPGHGTHVTGTAAGDSGLPANPTDPNHTFGDGMAPNAQILFQDIGIGNQLPGQKGALMWQQARAGGAFIHSNSWGGAPGPMDEYQSSDAEVDDYLFRNPDMLIVFAAGNDGPATSIHHPGSAKSVLTVGMTRHGATLSVAGDSSRGPAPDGRIKPDLMAPGISICSAESDGDNVGLDAQGPPTCVYSGTSMATPAVSAMAAMARQYFVEGFYPTGVRSAGDARIPSGALLKALLINGAENAAFSDTPSNASGWGRVWLDNSLYFNGDDRSIRLWDVPAVAGLAEGEQHQYTVSVAAGEELRATLVWYDPAPLMGGPALVNDLDLEVEPDSGGPFLGNVFNAGQSVTGGTRDSLNPVEAVIVRSPGTQDHTVRVLATDLPGIGEFGSDRQGYALVVSAAACTSAVTAAPSLAPLTSDLTGVQVNLSAAVGGADSYQVYRVDGDCSAAVEAFQLVGTTNALTFNDTHTQGGLEYGYRVRAADGCGEGPLSACQSIPSAAPCTLPPQFDTGSANVIGGGDICQASLQWTAATTRCPAASSVTYRVFRSTDPYFDPATEPPLASGVTGTSLVDMNAAPDLTSFYRVQAQDDLGNLSAPSDLKSYSAVGDNQLPNLTYVDPLEDGNAGTREVLALATLEAPWRVTDNLDVDDTFSYHNAPDNLHYPDAACAALTSRPIDLQAASISNLSYQALFELEADFDGVVVEISTDGGNNWQDLPPAGGYPGSFAQTGNACGYPNTQGAFTGTSPSFGASGFDPFSTDLSAFAGQTVMIRWRLSSDGAISGDGFYLDDIRVTNASRPGACLSNELIFRDGME